MRFKAVRVEHLHEGVRALLDDGAPLYRQALVTARDDSTVVTNVFTGRPARGIVNRLIREIGPITQNAPAFPLAAAALAPLRASTEAQGVNDFVNLWAGQAVALGRALPAGELTTMKMSQAMVHTRVKRKTPASKTATRGLRPRSRSVGATPSRTGRIANYAWNS